MTIKQVASELGISTKTLRRWEELNYFIPERDPYTQFRLYRPEVVKIWKRYMSINNAYEEKIKELGLLHKQANKYLETSLASEGKNIFFDIDNFGKVEDKIRDLELHRKELLKEILQFPEKAKQAIIQMEQEEK